jgi:hypothetical protein
LEATVAPTNIAGRQILYATPSKINVPAPILISKKTMSAKKNAQIQQFAILQPNFAKGI